MVERVREFYLGNKVDVSGGCETVVSEIARIDRMKFRERRALWCGKRFPLRMEGRVYRCCWNAVWE